MTDRQDFLRQLRIALADCYPQRARAELFAQDAGLSLTQIDLSGAPIEFWQRIVEEAERQGKVDALLELASEQAPARRDLADLRHWRVIVPELPCPYRGLEPFEAEHAEFYFGRDAMVQKLLAKLQETNFLVVVGPSGSGKSSLVRAGLVSALRNSALPGSAAWGIDILRPGPDPLRALAAPLGDRLAPGLSPVDRLAEARKLADHLAARALPMADILEPLRQTQATLPRLLLIVDQFEEAFTLCSDENLRQTFFESLLAAIQAPWVTVILTLRADFYGRVLADERLSQHIDQGLVNVIPMTVDERRKAIEQPALQTGRKFEEGLVQRILDAIADAPGDLPLLEFALTELWERQTADDRLTHAAYEAIGEVKGAIAKRADDTLTVLTLEQQSAVQGVFTRLVQVARPDEAAEDTRRRIDLAELAPDTQELVRRLADARLLVTGRDATSGEETIEVAHEALIRSWRQLQVWLDRDREFLLWRQRLHTLADIWEESGKDAASLLGGALLQEAVVRAEGRVADLSALEREYIEKSQAHTQQVAEEREAARQREVEQAKALAEAQRRRAFNLRMALGIALVAVIIISILLWQTLVSAQKEQAARAAEALARVSAEDGARAAKTAEAVAVVALKTSEASADLAQQQLALLEGERLLQEAKRLKEQGDIEGAIAKFAAAAQANPTLKIDLPAEEADVRRQVATKLVQDGEQLAAAGKDQEAVAEFQAALDLQPPPDTPVYVWVPPGVFTMGSADSDETADDDEKPQHKVPVAGFWIMRTEVTNGQYLRCVEAGACTEPDDKDYKLAEAARRPMTSVDWEQAKAYARWVGGRLPAEAEWERACRGTDERLYPWGNEAPTDDLARFYASSARDVGSYPEGASPLGLLDMAGNVYEWTSSGYEAYPYRADDGREGPNEEYRVLRGGAFDLYARYVRCAVRHWNLPGSRNWNHGFRVVASPSHS